MTDSPEPGPRLEFPANWDVLRDGDEAPSEAGPPDNGSPTAPPPILALLAASWGDAVAALAVCTTALASLAADGPAVDPAALPWAAALGVVWWFAAAALVVVRQGTPGMLLAGIAFPERVSPARLAGVLAAALLHAALLGLPSLLGPRRSPVAVAAGCPIRIASA